MFCIAFGLSMDYEVFLLSRIKEEYDLERDNERAVAIGLQKTGRIVTAAALLLTIVFIGIATSEVALVKAFGVGLGARGARRRVPDPRHARARVHAARGPAQLVVAALAAALAPALRDLGERADRAPRPGVRDERVTARARPADTGKFTKPPIPLRVRVHERSVCGRA